MRTIKYMIMALAGMIAAVSCAKEMQNTAPAGPLTISAVAQGLDAPTKTSYHRTYELLWNESEKIIVKDMDVNYDSFTLVEGAGTSEGRFLQDGPKALIGPVEAFYPASMVSEYKEDMQTYLRYTWPAAQDNNSTCPLYCKTTLKHTETETFTFSSLGSMAELRLYSMIPQTVTLKSIEIGDREKSMSGTFTVDEQGQAVISNSEAPGSILLSIDAYKLATAAKTFYVCIPSGKYEKPYAVLRTNDGRSLTVELQPFEATRGELCQIDLGVKGDTPDATKGTATTKEGKNVDWVRLWPFGPRFATINIGGSKPQDYGGYYAYGGHTSKDLDDVDKEINILSGNSDTATYLWGGDWRMPTGSELKGIMNYCNSEWVKIDSHWGIRVTGKDGYSGNSIFLPASGYYDVGDEFSKVNEVGYYRVSTWSGEQMPPMVKASDVLSLSKDEVYLYLLFTRQSCASVRPVYDAEE